MSDKSIRFGFVLIVTLFMVALLVAAFIGIAPSPSGMPFGKLGWTIVLVFGLVASYYFPKKEGLLQRLFNLLETYLTKSLGEEATDLPVVDDPPQSIEETVQLSGTNEQ